MLKNIRLFIVWTTAMCYGLVPQASAATITVTSANDSGLGSLRQAISDAANGDEIVFDPALNGVPIVLTSGTLDVVRSMTITGNGPANTIIDGNESTTVLSVPNYTVLEMSGVTIRNGNGWLGGGIHIASTSTLYLQNSVVQGNTGESGGGIHCRGAVFVSDTTVSGNSAVIGGGIDTRFISRIVNSTISNNTAETHGGGIFNRGNAEVSNSTLSGNSAEFGGAIWNYQSVQLDNVTITENTGTHGAGIGTRWLTFPRNSIIANQVEGQDCYLEQPRLFSSGYNLDSDGSCDLTEPTDVSGINPLLGPLANNGGPTMTHALLVGSPAIDSGSCTRADGALIETDQRGLVRWDEACDRGAFEYGAIPPDADQDGVLDTVDICPDTVIPESVPTNHLQVNRWALVDDDDVFDTTPPPGGGGGPEFEFSLQDTGGCSCEQIIERWALGWGHTKFGCSTGVMLQWIAYVRDYNLAQIVIETQQTTEGENRTLMQDIGNPSASASGTPADSPLRRQQSLIRGRTPRRGNDKK